MSTITVFYDGREIGHLDQWQQEGKMLMLDGNPLGFLEGMVIELTDFTDRLDGPTSNATSRIGALVGATSDTGVLIQLDELVSFRPQ